MSTHAAILVRTPDNIYAGAYVHFDGGRERLGRALLSDFNDQDKANRLVALGKVEAVKMGGFIQPWKDEPDPKPIFGATIEGTVLEIGGVHWVYVFADGKWKVDEIPARRPVKWKFRGIDLRQV